MRVHRLAPRMIGAAALALVALRPDRAGAADFEVQADTALQAYEVSDPWGEVVLRRRRVMQTLGLGAYNLQGDYRPGEADYRVVVLMRLNADFGVNAHLPVEQAGAETNFKVGDGARYIPGLEVAPIDMMYGYVEGRNVGNGLLGFRLGRQYMTDMLGWWSFDGGLVRITTPFYVQAEIYGGLEQRGGLPLSTSRFERQGIWRGSHSGFGNAAGQPTDADYPSFQYTNPAPAFGFALESAGPSFVHGRVSYRRVYNTGSSITQQVPFPGQNGGYPIVSGTRFSQERIGYAADINKSDLGGLRGGFSYDLYNQAFATYYGGIEGYLGKHVTVGADIDYFLPTFDADSIWNWFTHSPVTTISGRASIRPAKRFDVSASGGARLWSADGDPNTFGQKECKAVNIPGIDCNKLGTVYFDPSAAKAKAFTRDEKNRAPTQTLDVLANLNARYRFGTGDISFRGMLETGNRGSREGGDIAGEKGLDGGRYTLGARLSLYGWHDPTRPDRDATSFSYTLAAGFTPAQLANFRLEFEHDMNRLVGQRFRVLGLINLLVVK
jgi:hypothetical protein